MATDILSSSSPPSLPVSWFFTPSACSIGLAPACGSRASAAGARSRVPESAPLLLVRARPSSDTPSRCRGRRSTYCTVGRDLQPIPTAWTMHTRSARRESTASACRTPSGGCSSSSMVTWATVQCRPLSVVLHSFPDEGTGFHAGLIRMLLGSEALIRLQSL